jgi:hexosaminidase
VRFPRRRIIPAVGLTCLALCGVVAPGAPWQGRDAEPALVPRPIRVRPAAGWLDTRRLQVRPAPDAPAELRSLAGYAGRLFGANRAASGGPFLTLALREELSRLGAEGYLLAVSSVEAVLSAAAPAGLAHGLQTLRQLAMGRDRIPCGEIEDRPAFRWRGVMPDCSRHFMSAGFIKRYIDLLALHRMNVFHWHLTDDQGWRIEIGRYPRLTEVGAWRNEGEVRIRHFADSGADIY